MTERALVMGPAAVAFAVALAAPAVAVAIPKAPGPIIVITAPADGPGGWGHVMFDSALGIDPRQLPGGPGRDYDLLPGASVDTVSAALLEAEARGAAGCDTAAAFVGRPQVWEVAWYAPAPGGGFRLARRTRVSLGAVRCRAAARRANDKGIPHTLAQVALDDLTRLGGPAYAVGPPPEHGGQSPEINRILDRGSLVRDARAASPLRDWNSLAFDLTTDVGRAGRAVRLSATSLPASPSEAGDATWIQVPPEALRKALLAFLDRGPIELAARRPRRFALRDGACGRYAITLWDVGREKPTLIDDAYLTPLEADSLARDVADAIAARAPEAARAMRTRLGIVGSRPRPAPLATLEGVDTAGPDPVAIQLAPSEGDEFLRPVVYRVAGVPDSLLEQRFGRAINRADSELSLVGGWMARTVSRATMHALATVLARAASADTTGLDPMAQYPAWPATWRATAVDAAPGGKLAARAPRRLPTRRLRGRALEWIDHLPRDAEDDTRRVLSDIVELGLPPAREVRAVGEDPPLPALPSPEAERESLLVAAGSDAGVTFLGLSFWSHGGEPHHFVESTRLVAGYRDASSPGGSSDVITPIAAAGLRALLRDALDNPDVTAGAHRAYDDVARGDAFLEVRIVERRHGGNPTRLLWVSFLDRTSGARAIELLARTLEGSEPDVAAELRRQARVLQRDDSPPPPNHGGS